MIAADPAVRPGLLARGNAWVRHHIPTRESIEANRFLKPVAHRILVPSLWRLNRRSVPRGVALGLFSGVLFPFAHMAIAAVLALPFRANVPTAVGTTLLSNPLTIPAIWFAADRIGFWVLRFDRAVPGHPIASNVKPHVGWLHQVMSGSPGHHFAAWIVGSLILATLSSIAGYFAAKLLWRLKIARKWRRRHVQTGN